MRAPARPSLQATHLDAIRALAAFAVVVQHARQLFCVPDASILRQRPGALIYPLTVLGEPAVDVFFVLSGFLIASSIRTSWKSGRWSPIRYADARLTRLLVPLVPALLLTAFWDRLGTGLYGPSAPPYWNGIPTGMQAFTRLLGNVFFLQDVLVPVFGTNGPLWSLSREFWYYVVFPLLFFALNRGVPAPRRGVLLIVAALVLIFTGKEIVILFPLWLFGAVVAFLPSRNWAASLPFRSVTALGLIVSLLPWFTQRLPHRAPLFVTSFLFAAFVWSLLCGPRREPSRAYERLAGFGADISYTLYLVHVPLLAFLAAVYLRDHEPWTLEPLQALGVLGLSVAMVLYAVVLWFLFERNTRRIRSWVVARTTGRPSPEPSRT